MMVIPLEPGRIVMLAFPFTDATSTKFRPALVVSTKAYNSGEDFVAVPITSRFDAHGYRILKSEPYFAQTQLKTDSTVKWMKPMTVSTRIVTRILGVVPGDVLSEIQKLIRTIFSV
jgi:mRNA-degrading endonuclease toxin of MazEF toxin-antitoxin module